MSFFSGCLTFVHGAACNNHSFTSRSTPGGNYSVDSLDIKAAQSWAGLGAPAFLTEHTHLAAEPRSNGTQAMMPRSRNLRQGSNTQAPRSDFALEI